MPSLTPRLARLALPPRRAAAALGLCLLMAACGTPQERCISSVTRDLRVVDRLIAESEANLARGYGYVYETIYVPVWDYCGGAVLIQPEEGAPPVLIPGQMCLDDEAQTVRRAVAIDPAVEKRKLSGLQDQRRKLLKAAEPAIAACRANYPN